MRAHARAHINYPSLYLEGKNFIHPVGIMHCTSLTIKMSDPVEIDILRDTLLKEGSG